MSKNVSTPHLMLPLCRGRAFRSIEFGGKGGGLSAATLQASFGDMKLPFYRAETKEDAIVLLRKRSEKKRKLNRTNSIRVVCKTDDEKKRTEKNEINQQSSAGDVQKGKTSK